MTPCSPLSRSFSRLSSDGVFEPSTLNSCQECFEDPTATEVGRVLPRKLAEFYHGSWRKYTTEVGAFLARQLAEFWHGSWRGPQLQPAAAARYPQPAAHRGSLQQPPQSQPQWPATAAAWPGQSTAARALVHFVFGLSGFEVKPQRRAQPQQPPLAIRWAWTFGTSICCGGGAFWTML